MQKLKKKNKLIEIGGCQRQVCWGVSKGGQKAQTINYKKFWGYNIQHVTTC